MTIKDIGKIAHILKYSHGMCVVGDLDKTLQQVYIWNGNRAILSFVLNKSIFIHFEHNSTKFYERDINSDDRNIYIDYDGSGVKQNQSLIKIYN